MTNKYRIGNSSQVTAKVRAARAKKATRLVLRRIGEMEYSGTLGSDAVHIAFGTGPEEGWTLHNYRTGKHFWLATSIKAARKEAVRRAEEIAS